MTLKQYLPALLLVLLPLSARSQFYTKGSEPASVKWSSIETGTYKLIYPRGLDSLARVYASNLESIVPTVGNGALFTPNQGYKRKMPVILHPYNVSSNGEVVWAPRRMELQTTPDAFDPEPAPWEQHLVIHESRHVVQMQAGATKPFRFWNGLIGELAPGGVAALYGGPAFLEGDAVSTETAMTASGRGRSADFLEYYRVSFAEGDFRDYWKWRYGSQRYYTPDYYRAGYVLASGMCHEFGEPAFTQRFYSRIADKHGVALFNLQKSVKEVSGLKFDQAFERIAAGMQAEWAADDSLRAPFMHSEQITPTPSRYTKYRGTTLIGENIYTVRSGITKNAKLIKIDPFGRESTVSSFSSNYCRPRYSTSTGRLYWSEIIKDWRWEMRSSSDIRYRGASGTTHSLTRNQRYFHPAPSPQDKLLAVTEYPVEGGSAVVILNTQYGFTIKRFQAPDGMQIVETVWLGDRLFASAITAEGIGIYEVENFTQLLAPQNTKIKELWESEGKLMFTCDRTGVDELYALDPSSGKVMQLSSTRFGSSDFCFDADNKYLYYSMPSKDGRMLYRSARSELMPREVDFGQKYLYPAAESLSAAQKQLSSGSSTGIAESSLAYEASETQYPVSRPYNKLSGLFRPHSWLPIFFNHDAVSSLSLENISTNVGLGATAFLQNELGTAYGFAGYHYRLADHKHIGHLNLTYAGLLPVIEVSVSVNDGNQRDLLIKGDNTAYLHYRLSNIPKLKADISAYIPWGRSVGGITTGFIPKINFSANNDRLIREYLNDGPNTSTMLKASVTLRSYIMQRTPESAIYPKLGIGAEIGYSFRPGMTDVMNSNLFGRLYGYLPGLAQTHGLKLSALAETLLGNTMLCESFAIIAPRGYSSSSVASLLALFSQHCKYSADYAMPIFPVDWSWLSPLAYVRNFELVLHADVATMSSNRGNGNLFSAGADFVVRLGNLLWIPYDTRIGVSYNYNGGSLYNTMTGIDPTLGHHTLSMIFSIDL